MSVGHDGTPNYDAGMAQGHLEFAPNGQLRWHQDERWDGASEVQAGRKVVKLSALGTDEPVITVVDLTTQGVASTRILGALFHRHVAGEAVFSIVTEDISSTLAGTRAVEVISRTAYYVIHTWIAENTTDQGSLPAHYYQLTSIAWLGSPLTPLIDASRRDFWSQQTTRRSRARSRRSRR